jgi:hypothetical protein
MMPESCAQSLLVDRVGRVKPHGAACVAPKGQRASGAWGLAGGHSSLRSSRRPGVPSNRFGHQIDKAGVVPGSQARPRCDHIAAVRGPDPPCVIGLRRSSVSGC